MAGKKVWQGRLAGQSHRLMEAFGRSVDIDRRLWREDVKVNRAWAKALARLGIYTVEELAAVLQALEDISQEFEQGRFVFLPEDEDIHVAIERRLTAIAGEAGARIHTGRSRNDQVMTDLRLYLKRQGHEWAGELVRLQRLLIKLANAHRETILPGYTHWQQAQPITLAHYLLAVFSFVDAALDRLAGYYARLDIMPLGSGALAGSGFPVDRDFLARELGFQSISMNSIAATGLRDSCEEILFIVASFFTALSRVSAEFQMWNASEFGFIELSDAFATGSSMMPQKKNPDALELIRGRAAAAITAAAQIQILQKGLPLTYNRDLQEDKPMLFQQLDAVLISTRVFCELLKTAVFHRDRMMRALDDRLLATDMADYLVEKGVPFRSAHEIVGKIVVASLQSGCGLHELPLAEYRKHSELFEYDIFTRLDPKTSISRRRAAGGTAPEAVRAQLDWARARLAGYEEHPFLRMR